MLKRYKQTKNGKSEVAMTIYLENEHRIDNRLIDFDAIWAIKKIQRSGGQAYIVGGAVRDLLLDKIPKDFDIATNLVPKKVQKLFYNSRIIGKRFKIVHLYFGDKIFEVSTFRSDVDNDAKNDNTFGTIEQDAKRRDFTINSFYYDPVSRQLLDFNDSMADFQKRRIRSIIPLKTSFREDPVRMIRAIKFSQTTGFKLDWQIRASIRKNYGEIATCSVSRLTEEIGKILASGYSRPILQQLDHYKLLPFLLPSFSVYIRFPKVIESLDILDSRINAYKKGNGPEVPKADLVRFLVKDVIVFGSEELTPHERFKETFRQIKVLISPMTPPNYEIEQCCSKILKDMGYKVPKGSVRKSPMLQKRSKNLKPAPRSQGSRK